MKQISTSEFRRDLPRIKDQLNKGESFVIFDYLRKEKIGVFISYDKYLALIDAGRKKEEL